MTVKEYLTQMITIDRQIEGKLEDAENWRSIARSTSAPISDMKVQTSSSGGRIEGAVINAVQCEREAYESAQRLMFTKAKIMKQIDDMDNKTYSVILHDKYISNLPLKQISDNIHYTYDSTKRIHGFALSAFYLKYHEDIDKA